ncbi:MaoC family dehydratase [Nocardioides sp. Bht2]|uniref:MaoC family dehydratase n=1 Tax=Nocardioides sp. Bht2 TaxID=3392297 RepID=UPI0039B3D05B
MKVFTTVEEVVAAANTELGSSDWITIDQRRVDQFADATGDHQWIHVDVERAKTGPFGGTIAHGYLTLALIPWLGSQIFTLRTPGAKLNYGLNKVRFPAPVLVGAKIRLTVSMGEVAELPTGQQLTFQHVVEIDGQEKPACVAESVVLLLP